MTSADQFTAMNTAGWLTSFQTELTDILTTLGQKGVETDWIGFHAGGVPCKLWMPKGSPMARVQIGTTDDTDAVEEASQVDIVVPTGWFAPPPPATP